MSLKDDNLRFVALHTLADAIKKELGWIRTEHTGLLIDRYKDEGTTSYKVSLPEVPGVVATVTLRVPQPELEYFDDDALLKWAADHHPDLVELEEVPAVPEQVIPAVPAYERPVIAQKKLAALAKHFKKGEGGVVVDTTTGLVVAGARYSTPPPPNQFEVRYEGDGRTAVTDAYRAGRLNEVIAGSTLGAITAGPVVERRLVAVPASVVPVAPPVDGPDPAEGHGLTVTSVCDCGAPIPPGSGLCCGCAAFADEGEFDPGDWDSVADQPTSSGW